MRGQGFFDLGTGFNPANKSPSGGGCASCKLDNRCHSPKMPVCGEGKKRILIVGEAPGKTEDERGTAFVGQSGQLLRKTLKQYGIEPNRDCWFTNAVRCRPPGNVTPTTSQINNCRRLLLKDITDLNPSVIIPLGTVALDGLLKHRLSGRINNVPNSNYFGERIPDIEMKCWICPTYHPAYLLRSNDVVLDSIWATHIQTAIQKALVAPPVFNYHNRIMTTQNPSVAIEWIDRANDWEAVAFDYETTGIKPTGNSHAIVTASLSNGAAAYSFPFFYNNEGFLKSWKRLMMNKTTGKIAHKMDFENDWTYARAGQYWVRNWIWDTCLAAHCIHNKKNVGLKFLTYTKLGIIGYDSNIDEYLKSPAKTEDGRNAYNRVREAPMDELLQYNAMDSLFTFHIYEIQKQILTGKLLEGFRFFMEGCEALSKVQMEGMKVDVGEINRQKRILTKRIGRVDDELKASDEWNRWEGKSPFNPDSNVQLSKLLYDIIGYEKPADGTPKTNEEAIANIGSSFTDNILKARKLKKTRDTYLAQFDREQINGVVRPFFNLHLVKTYRSSSNSPNFQNIPKRDKQAMKIVRSIIKPGPARRLIEYDYKGVEVCISACYHKDTNMIKYITDDRNDMHRDTAADMFLKDKNQITKEERYCGKNGFVFPAFYGSTTHNIAPNVWRDMPDYTKEHLKKEGIDNYEKFQHHIENVEKIFWGERFRIYAEWKQKIYRKYQHYNYVDTLSGFRVHGPMKFTEVTNYPIQGSAFHCLLWSLIHIQKEMRDKDMRSSIIGQIHDSLICDVVLEEEPELDRIVKLWATEKIREHWPWIIVPLKIEKERSECYGNWSVMQDCGYL